VSKIIPLGKGLGITLAYPLGKDCDQELTKHAIGGGATPQPRLGDPRLRDGISGGDAGGVWFDTNKRNSLADERQSLGPTVIRDSNVTEPESEDPSGHQTLELPDFGKVPLLGAPSGDSDINHPIFGPHQRREAPSSDPPRATGPLRIARGPGNWRGMPLTGPDI
jgi:hypothetical protein